VAEIEAKIVEVGERPGSFQKRDELHKGLRHARHGSHSGVQQTVLCFAALSSGMAICPSGVMVLSEVTVIVFVRAS
jgi:hypothetical protein